MDAIKEIPFIQADYETYSQSCNKFRIKYLNYPRNVSIETQVNCNSSCIFCPYPKSPRKGQELSDELFYKIIEDLSEIPKTHRYEITLHRINEPLLDRRIQTFSNVIAKNLPSAIQSFWTNGTMLKKGTFEWMADHHGANLTVSLNSVNEEEHIQMMGFGLKNVFDGLDYLHKLVESDQFTLHVTLCAPFINRKQAVEYGAFCNRRWPRFRPAIRPLFEWRGGESVDMDINAISNYITTLKNRAAYFACGQWFDLHILANGYTTKCCIDETGNVENPFFNVRTRKVLEIYREGQELREQLPSRSDLDDCKGCLHLG